MWHGVWNQHAPIVVVALRNVEYSKTAVIILILKWWKTLDHSPLSDSAREKIRPIMRQLKLQDFIIYYIFAYMFFFKKLSVWRNDIMNAFLLCSVWTPVGGWFYVDAGWHGRMSPDLTLSSGKEVSVIDHCWWQDRQQQWHWVKPSVELLLKKWFP